jgi:hypothetical protein
VARGFFLGLVLSVVGSPQNAPSHTMPQQHYQSLKDLRPELGSPTVQCAKNVAGSKGPRVRLGDRWRDPRYPRWFLEHYKLLDLDNREWYDQVSRVANSPYFRCANLHNLSEAPTAIQVLCSISDHYQSNYTYPLLIDPKPTQRLGALVSKVQRSSDKTAQAMLFQALDEVDRLLPSSNPRVTTKSLTTSQPSTISKPDTSYAHLYIKFLGLLVTIVLGYYLYTAWYTSETI